MCHYVSLPYTLVVNPMAKVFTQIFMETQEVSYSNASHAHHKMHLFLDSFQWLFETTTINVYKHIVVRDRRKQLCDLSSQWFSCYSNPKMMAFDQSPILFSVCALFGWFGYIVDVMFGITKNLVPVVVVFIGPALWAPFIHLFLAGQRCQTAIMCLFVDSETHCFIRKDGAKKVVCPAVFGISPQSVPTHESLSCCWCGFLESTGWAPG